MKKKLLSSILGLGLVFGVATSAFAATDGYPRTSGWDYVGQEYYYIDPGVTRWSGTHYSTGGDFKITIDGHKPFNPVSNPHLTGYVYESDGSGVYTLIGTFTYVPDSFTDKSYTFNTTNYVDGTNKEAEIVVKYTANYDAYGSTTVWYYD
jgi:hypothetical protein